MHELLVNRHSYRVVVKSVSAHCVCQSQLLSNPVTFVHNNDTTNGIHHHILAIAYVR